MRKLTHLLVAAAFAFSAVAVVPAVASAKDAAAASVAGAAGVTSVATSVHGRATGRVTVGFDPAREHRVLSAIKKLGGTVEQSSDGLSMVALDPPAGETAAEFADAVEDLAGVEYAEVEHYVYALGTPNDYYYPLQWDMGKIQLPKAREASTGSSSVVVAVIDTGLDRSHPDRPAHIDWSHAKDYIDGDSSPDDGNGHGTHVAGTIAAATNNSIGVAGIAPNVTILPIRVLNDDGEGGTLSLAAAIEYAVNQGADVINLSLGSASSSIAVENACAYASSHDVVVVAASGNEADRADYSPGTIYYPAAYDDVVAVGATTISNTHAAYSDYGPALDIVAPGGDAASSDVSSWILSLWVPDEEECWPSVGYWPEVGTSMAAPHVTGVAALVRSVAPSWDATEIESCLYDSAQDLGSSGRDDYFGHGLVRADLALEMALDGKITVLPVSAPSTCSWGGTATLSGTLKTWGGTTIAYQPVTIQAKAYGASSWTTLGTKKTSGSGAFQFYVKPAKKTYYRVVYRGSTGSYLSKTSTSKTVTPKAYLTKPKAPSKIKKGRSFTATGYLRPKHTAGKKTVRIKAYRKVNGKYKYYKSYYAVNKSYTSATTKYVKKIKLPKKGKWKLVATVTGDSTHAATSSSARYVKVY